MYLADRAASWALESIADFADQQLQDVFKEEDADDGARVAHEGAVDVRCMWRSASSTWSPEDTASRRRMRQGVIGCSRSSPVAYRTSLR